ncbi:SPX domain-containing protein [Mycena indigotica]|uniref:SPX domain-containing protein n=1 Tax=Mycena indigotica TaxID=2126181 RepID=A0A8H6WF57_9AGAR|nr:SPX domain-containing protein [Mycena indigotica]KAF7312543.1 SPX domain-containing protein [Mycena indigotica]
MSPPLYTVLRRRSLRRPIIFFLIFLALFWFAPHMRNVVFDAQHSTKIAFKLAAGRATVTHTQIYTHTRWTTRTFTHREYSTIFLGPAEIPASTRSPPARPTVLGEHNFRSDGLLEVNPAAPHPIFSLVARAQLEWDTKLASASKTLRQAVAEYTRRYNRPPPQGFDVWWGYVVANRVQLPDEYDQIDRDLGPFYGVEPLDLQGIQTDWEAHADSYTIGKDLIEEKLALLNFTLPENEAVRFELVKGAFQMIELLDEVEHELPAFRAVFSPHDNPNLVTDWELRKLALDAAKEGRYIDIAKPPSEKHGWLSACPPFSPARLDSLPLPFDELHPNTGLPSIPGQTSTIFDIDRFDKDPRVKTFVYNHRLAMDPCLHPSHFYTHGAYLPHGTGPGPYRRLIPQFSYSTTPLHSDIRPAVPLNWVTDDFPNEGRPPPLGFSWEERTDERLQWRGSNTGIWHAADGRWREAHRIRLAALAGGSGGANASVLMPLKDEEEVSPVGPPEEVPRARFVNALLDVAFAGRPLNCEPKECAKLEEMFEWRAAHDLKKAAHYKFILDVDGNGWSSRFKRLMNSGSLIFKASGYPEWFTDRLAPWVHFIPIQNSFSDLLDALVFFRGDPSGQGAHDVMARRIAEAGREWSRKFWRKEDLVAYNYRLFLEYGRVMSSNREEMSFIMWEDDQEDETREQELVDRWKRK